jgi:hypothetical protein
MIQRYRYAVILGRELMAWGDTFADGVTEAVKLADAVKEANPLSWGSDWIDYEIQPVRVRQ